MKNKDMIALVIGIICALILSGVLIWSAFDTSDQKNDPVTDSNVEENNQKTEEPSADNNNMPDTNEQTPDQVSTDDSVESDNTDNSEEDTSNVDSGKVNPNPTTAAEIKSLLNDPLLILVNRDHKVPSDYAGLDLVSYNEDQKMNRTAAAALKKLIAAGKAEGYNYILYSGYRSYTRQHNNYYNKIDYWKNQGKSEEEALRLTNQYYAPPGASEHHTGLAADVCIPEIVNEYACLHEDYAYTEEFKWFSTHAHEYGFILRYRLGDEEITGYNYEPWHYRYVGVEVATEIYERDITFEEYIADLEDRLKRLES